MGLPASSPTRLGAPSSVPLPPLLQQGSPPPSQLLPQDRSNLRQQLPAHPPISSSGLSRDSSVHPRAQSLLHLQEHRPHRPYRPPSPTQPQQGQEEQGVRDPSRLPLRSPQLEVWGSGRSLLSLSSRAALPPALSTSPCLHLDSQGTMVLQLEGCRHRSDVPKEKACGDLCISSSRQGAPLPPHHHQWQLQPKQQQGYKQRRRQQEQARQPGGQAQLLPPPFGQANSSNSSLVVLLNNKERWGVFVARQEFQGDRASLEEPPNSPHLQQHNHEDPRN
mmetsp:Transcript_43523/g.85872  ORF Transcript_43523/g.85872 Transcript_43523/m.85872 type:complete len:277 (+) Transcript_43523:495-1325(+)